ncbi:MAG: hypothetical protein ABFS12_09515 [Bacteroidota bacterium]
MNNTILKKILILLFFVSSSVTSILAQELTEKQKKEHQAVRNFFNTYQSQNVNSIISTENKSDDEFLHKTTGHSDRKAFFMNGNKISTEVYNYGGIAPGYGLLRGVNNFVWKNLSYVFTFGPIVGAEVIDTSGKEIHIISDGLNDYTSPMLQELNPTGDTLWQWQPLPGYADPDQPHMASNPAVDSDEDGKPDSWPRDWYNPTLGKYVWPGYLSQNASNSDLEVFWAMDDRDNVEFEYYPFQEDISRKGIGVQVDGRAFQWSNALAENTIFFVYTITNVSGKDLDSVFFGIYGDPDLGGGSPENKDDNGYFIPPYSLDSVDVSDIPVYARSMVYFFDPDMEGDFGLPLGYLGCKFLESPGNTENNFDDDGDGMVDESQEDGIDNDGDWVVDFHDLGVDGIALTFDEGEGDGIPTAGIQLSDGSLDPLHPGEPNFEFTDLDESDQIGLTSFNSWTWNQDKISDDESMWNRSIPGNFGAIQQNTDLVFIFGSGYISLKAGETKRISMALLLGEDLEDLLLSAETVQTIYNQNYQFFKPPNKPTVTAVPDDKKVTLYWDTVAEESVDPITGEDFEGYVIYRSTDPLFNDIQTITDGKGSGFLNEPLKTLDGFGAKWDLDNEWEGYHPVQYQGRGLHYNLGNNSGLVHSYVDSNKVINGQTYYYTVVAYDHGDSVGIPPTETTKKITLDPITNTYTFDKNTVQVIPGPRASGYIPPVMNDQNVTRINGIGTGDIVFKVMNDLVIEDEGKYTLKFSDSLITSLDTTAQKNYSLLNNLIKNESTILYDTKFAQLGNLNLADDEELKVQDSEGKVYERDIDYVINLDRGTIRRTEDSSIPDQSSVDIFYRFYPIAKSTYLDGEDSNPTFDGVSLIVKEDKTLSWNEEESEWIAGNSNFEYRARLSSVGVDQQLYPGDYEIEFASTNIDSAMIFSGTLVKIPVNYSVREVSSGVPVKIITYLAEQNPQNEQWDPGEEIAFFKPGTDGTNPGDLTWGIVVIAPSDSNVTPSPPTDGDILYIASYRPFDGNDEFELQTSGAEISDEKAASNLDNIYVVPNPYVGYNALEPTNKLPGQSRGERRIYFENLPSKCTIRIYSLVGDPVTTLHHDVLHENGREYWNLLNEDGFSVSFGVYIAHIEAPEIGEKIVKFALIK